MPRRWVAIIVCAVLVAAAGGQSPRPDQDDADLNAVALVGDRRAWAVGDHGSAWTTEDGGRNWRFVRLPLDMSVQSACFLTDRVGWLTGCRTTGSGRDSVVLRTTDGGKSWQLHPLPVQDVREACFFDLQNGVAVGQATSAAPTGIASTTDGGQTWQAISGSYSQGWRSAAFDRVGSGVVAGKGGRFAAVADGALVEPPGWPQERWGWHDVALAASGTGWLVGDGATVLLRPRGQSSWQTVPTPLPSSLRDSIDFRGVAAIGRSAWLVGTPGTTIWYTPDGGQSWQRQLTGQTLPLRAIGFSDKRHGIAVGSLGVILSTQDGGETWTPARGRGRRLAMLNIYARPGGLSLGLIGKTSAEDGYRSRSVVVVPPRNAEGRTGDAVARLESALHAAGASGLETGWRWSLAIPDADTDREQLVAAWQAQSEGRLDELLQGWIVRLVRTWRPSVVVMDVAGEGDAITSVVNEAVQRAVFEAGDATRWAVASQLSSLRAWKVSKLYRRVPAGSRGDVSVIPHEFLPRSGEVLLERVARAAAHAPGLTHGFAEVEGFRFIAAGEDQGRMARGPRLFSGLGIGPGTAARRSLRPKTGQDAELGVRIASRQRGVAAYLRLIRGRKVAAEALEGQVVGLLRGLDAGRAGWQLWSLSEQFRMLNRVDLHRQMLVDLVRRNQDHEMSVEAFERLLVLEGSEEMRWQRLRESKRDRQIVTTSPQPARSARNKPGRTGTLQRPGATDFTRVRRVSDSLRVGQHADLRTERRQAEQDLAIGRARILRSLASGRYASPSVQLPLASLLRARGAATLADTNLQSCRRRQKGGPWERVLRQESWLSRPRQTPPVRMVSCQTRVKRPLLDGVLSDECWQQAMEIPLRRVERQAIGTDYSFAQVAADGEFLYLAARLTKSTRVRQGTAAIVRERRHDAALKGHDRVSILMDTDRDYVSWYRVDVDCRGQVAESCGGDNRWNPRCFVAVDAGEGGWCVELAIPWNDLAEKVPAQGQAWAIQVVRTEPGIGWQSWGEDGQAAGFDPIDLGLLVFGKRRELKGQ